MDPRLDTIKQLRACQETLLEGAVFDGIMKLENFYYVGASTIPGTGLPMVIISSKLVTDRIQNDACCGKNIFSAYEK